MSEKDRKNYWRQKMQRDCGFVLSQWYLIWKEIYYRFYSFFFANRSAMEFLSTRSFGTFLFVRMYAVNYHRMRYDEFIIAKKCNETLLITDEVGSLNTLQFIVMFGGFFLSYIYIKANHFTNIINEINFLSSAPFRRVFFSLCDS